MSPQSLSDALKLYKDSLNQQPAEVAESTFHKILRTFIYYIFQEWKGPIPKTLKLSPLDIEYSWNFMDKISLERLKDVVEIQKRIFEERGGTDYQKQTYGSSLRQFMGWMKQQDWCPFPADPIPPRNCAPRYRYGHGAVYSESVSGRHQLPPYRLLERETPSALQTQLEQFYTLFTAARQPKRPDEPIKSGVAGNYIISIRAFLGWFHRYARPIYENGAIIAFSADPQVPHIALEELNLELLVPKLDQNQVQSKADAEQKANQIAEYIDLWFCKFLDFLELDRASKSSRSLFTAGTGLHALTRFQYHDQTKDPKYRDIPAMAVVRRHIRQLDAKIKQQKRVSDIDMQWLDLPDVWRGVVTPLRQGCAYRSVDGHLRSITAIAHSFQLFIIWACLTFRPPRRQQEFCELKMALSCPIDPPEGLKPGQVIHPLPVDREEDKDHGYLFKDLDGLWYMDMTPESYKTGATYGHQDLKIPNEPLADGKCFYDYLEAFLYGYYRDKQGNWISGGQPTNPFVKGHGQWYSLRMAFNPDHNYVFVRPYTGGYYEHSSFGKQVRASSNRLTGQRVYPHLLRSIFATWFLDQGYTPERLASLAHAMGHSEAALRRLYDRRKAKDKTRRIEETLSQLLPDFMG